MKKELRVGDKVKVMYRNTITLEFIKDVILTPWHIGSVDTIADIHIENNENKYLLTKDENFWFSIHCIKKVGIEIL